MPDEKKPEKSPYGDCTIEEVMEAEAGNYYIQIGDNFFESETGKVAFSKKRADHFFLMIWEGLRNMKESGNEEEKKDAEFCLLNFRVVPLRFH